MSNIYCGITEVPKNKVRGTQSECLEMGQVRYYGLTKIDKSLMKKRTVKYQTQRNALQFEISKHRGLLRKFKLEYESYGGIKPEKKEIAKQEFYKVREKLSKLIKEYAAFEKEHAEKKESKSKKTKKESKNKKTKKESKNKKTKKTKKESKTK